MMSYYRTTYSDIIFKHQPQVSLTATASSTMAAHDRVRWHPPLKAPAIEVIDLLSDTDSIDTLLSSGDNKGKHDAYSTVVRAQEKADGDAQWHAPLKSPAIQVEDLPSRSIPTNLGEVLNDDAKARDASPDGSDSDEDSQWSLYEDALDGDEDDIALHSSTDALNSDQLLALLIIVSR